MATLHLLTGQHLYYKELLVFAINQELFLPNSFGGSAYSVAIWCQCYIHASSLSAGSVDDEFLKMSFCLFLGIVFKTTTVLLNGKRIKLQLW